MAASYSSFLSSQFYSPIFNTALFDGAFRIYFSQSYESTALKIYHLIQSEHPTLWSEYKKWSETNKKNVFILIYPTSADVGLAFSSSKSTPAIEQWEDGLAIGLENTFDDDQNTKFTILFDQIIQHLNLHLKTVALAEKSNVKQKLNTNEALS
jgi:hypothetical protein